MDVTTATLPLFFDVTENHINDFIVLRLLSFKYLTSDSRLHPLYFYHLHLGGYQHILSLKSTAHDMVHSTYLYHNGNNFGNGLWYTIGATPFREVENFLKSKFKHGWLNLLGLNAREFNQDHKASILCQPCGVSYLCRPNWVFKSWCQRYNCKTMQRRVFLVSQHSMYYDSGLRKVFRTIEPWFMQIQRLWFWARQIAFVLCYCFWIVFYIASDCLKMLCVLTVAILRTRSGILPMLNPTIVNLVYNQASLELERKLNTELPTGRILVAGESIFCIMTQICYSISSKHL